MQSRVLAEAADWAAAGPEEVLAQLDALEDVVTARETLLRHAGQPVLRPEVDRPGVMRLVEELSVLGRWWADLAQGEWRYSIDCVHEEMMNVEPVLSIGKSFRTCSRGTVQRGNQR